MSIDDFSLPITYINDTNFTSQFLSGGEKEVSMSKNKMMYAVVAGTIVLVVVLVLVLTNKKKAAKSIKVVPSKSVVFPPLQRSVLNSILHPADEAQRVFKAALAAPGVVAPGVVAPAAVVVPVVVAPPIVVKPVVVAPPVVVAAPPVVVAAPPVVVAASPVVAMSTDVTLDTKSMQHKKIFFKGNATKSKGQFSLFSKSEEKAAANPISSKVEKESSHDVLMRNYSFENFRNATMNGSPKSILVGEEDNTEDINWRATGHTRAAYERHVVPLGRLPKE
jgi:hypothetical protein